MNILTESLSAAVGGAISSGILYPLEIIKTNMQSSSSSSSSSSTSPTSNNNNNNNNKSIMKTYEALVHDIVKSDGIVGLYKGVFYAMLLSAMEKAGYFAANTFLYSINHVKDMNALILGYMSEWMHLPFTYPLQQVITQVQTSHKSLPSPPSSSSSSLVKEKKVSGYIILKEILRHKGIIGLYHGMSAYMILCLKSSLQYTIFHKLKVVVLARGKGGKELSAAQAFLIGAVSRIISTCIVFPAIRYKVLKQANSTSSDNTSTSTKSSSVSLVDIVGEYGVSELYRGIGPELTRGVLSSGIMLMIKEKMKYSIHDILLLLFRLLTSHSHNKLIKK